MTGSTSDALETVLSGESQRLLLTQNAMTLAKYGAVRKEIQDLHTEIKARKSRINTLVKNAKKQLDPFWDKFDPTSKAGVEDLSIYKFIDRIGTNLIGFITNSNTRLQLIDTYATMLLPALSSENKDLGSVMLADESGTELMTTVMMEYKNTVQQFEQLLGSIYLGTRTEYKKMRRKFLGGNVNEKPDNDSIEDQLMMSFFGGKRPSADTHNGPAVALINENCILTQLLIDVADSLPRYYEKVTPVLKRGKLTGKTQKSKVLDDGEIQDFAQTLLVIANPTYMAYVNDPSKLTSTIMNTVKLFQGEYAQIAGKLHELVLKINPHIEEQRRVIEDPTVLVKQYNRINFLAIRPSAEDIAPRTKMDHDVAIARTKLFAHLHETIEALSGMSRYYDDNTEEYCIKRIKEAIELRKLMEDILRTEEQKNLARNIEDDNEFYQGKSGNLGSLGVEREPAPKIRYENVIGDSFITAKKHIEEVVKVASHPHIMRLSAPRGLKSNVMLIGPYGCGKTEMAKAIGGDKRIIGFNVATADLLTAYMHESVKNVKRMYDHAKDLRRNSRHTKPVGILMDEFDRLFSFGQGVHSAYDGDRMTGVLQEMMDGIGDYEGVFLVAMTNVPKQVPEAVMRRFKYVDVVGQLNQAERAKLFKMFLTRGLPVDPSVTEDDYLKWADMLNHAPGDVIGKVTDEIHFKFMHELVMGNAKVITAIERNLSKKLTDREAGKKDFEFLKTALGKHKTIVGEDVTSALETVISQPQVKMQIAKAKQTYKDAEDIKKGLASIADSNHGFGGVKKSDIWSRS